MQSLCQGTREGGTQFPDLEMVGFIKEVKFEDLEKRVEIIQAARGLEWSLFWSLFPSDCRLLRLLTHQPRGR